MIRFWDASCRTSAALEVDADQKLLRGVRP
jgi:hypothetical protein